MKKKNLLSIGELSKITGIHIKALRYYDSLGILPPAYVDPESGYRYYSFYQKAVVDAIRFCVDLDIPLKDFPDYADETAPYICYKDLVEHGSRLAEEKMRIMEKRLALLKTMQAEIERSEKSYRNDAPESFSLPERSCYITPYEGRLCCDSSNQLMKKTIMEIYRHGLKLGNSSGLLLLEKNGRWEQYLFVDVDLSDASDAKLPEILHIPAGQYLCRRIGHSDIHQVWNWSMPHIPKEKIKLVMETELFVGNYRFSEPVLEQRCLLKQ